MLESIRREAISGRERMVRDYRKAQAGEHPLFATVRAVVEHYGVSRKHLWELSAKMAVNDEDPNCLLPGKRGARRPHNKPPKDLERVIICLRNRLGWSADEIAAVLAERGGWRDEPGRIWRPSARGIRSLFGRYPVAERQWQKAIRYEHANPGDLGHIDIKKLPNIKGRNPKQKWYKIALIDDHTRICYEERIANKSARTAVAFLHRAVAWFAAQHGIVFKAILSDNGKEFTCHSRRGRIRHKFEKALAKHGIKHRYTRPYRPQTNGKVERFWQIWDKECWQRQTFASWEEYDAANAIFMHRYNHWRRHGGIGRQTPVQRLQAWKKKKLERLCGTLHNPAQRKNTGDDAGLKIAA